MLDDWTGEKKQYECIQIGEEYIRDREENAGVVQNWCLM
ncbi:hypothetical protein SAMN05444406_10392 [Caldicoprobacter faecalis]|jgi:hypothetical protein|uniref:Uncharacterized protein n=1 Tax=Caldicoprobacter faecalis TaxID=937334 RepID=A0A1I5SX73_9FIRM|nr:hypothetical protein SAMN05444406_10392 [Caldicoprobacter faecalis]